MLPVKGTNTMWEIPPRLEEVCDGFPFVLGGWHWNHLLTVLFDDGICNFWDDADDTALPNTKCIHQTLVVIPSSKVSECTEEFAKIR